MKTVQTVRGPIPADQLGFVLPHEHIIVDTYDVRRNSEGVLLDHQMAIDEVGFYKAAGGDTMVEQTIYGLHPDPEGLRDISEKTGVHIIAGTGFYWEMYYPQWLANMSTSEITKRFVEHITVGFPGTDIRAGFMGELGTSHRGITPTETKVLQAAAHAQKEIGIPIGTHALFTEIGIDQLNVLEEAGADLEITVIGHCDTNRDVNYSRKLLKRGVWIAYDAVGQFDKQTDERRAESITTLVREGYLDKILISTDIAGRSRMVTHGGKGYGYLLTHFLPMLRDAGLTEAEISTLTRANPQRFLAGK
jgi:predicted metal-dependent phosphotriesterase family hydrolase